MSQDAAHLVASLLFLSALVLVVLGVNAENTVLWGAGLAAVVAGSAFALATRWLGAEEESGAAEPETSVDAEEGER